MSNTPDIRFKGFNEPWEQHKLGNIILDYSEKNPENEELPVLTSSRQGIQKQEDHFGSEQKHDTTDYNVIPRGYCTYRNRSDDKTFTFNINDCVEKGIVSKFYPVFSIVDGNAKFITEYLNTNADIRNKLAVLAVGTSQVVLSLSNLKNLSILVPNKKEQDKVGEVIIVIDTLITLHQRKCDELSELKKFMLQKMFPKNGEQFPEIRFSGFTDPWEQCKVGEISTITAGGTPSTRESSYWEPKEIPWLSSGEVHKKYVYNTDEMISEKGLNNSSAKWVEKGSVLIALAGQGKTRGTVAITRIPITTNQSIAAIKFDDILYPDYAFQNLDSRYDELRNISSGDGTRGGLNKQLLSDIEIMFPALEEQKKIGDYFRNLDNLITLHQRKCDELKNFKTFMLQNMFPKKG